jgi:hypothetical protein
LEFDSVLARGGLESFAAPPSVAAVVIVVVVVVVVDVLVAVLAEAVAGVLGVISTMPIANSASSVGSIPSPASLMIGISSPLLVAVVAIMAVATGTIVGEMPVVVGWIGASSSAKVASSSASSAVAARTSSRHRIQTGSFPRW